MADQKPMRLGRLPRPFSFRGVVDDSELQWLLKLVDLGLAELPIVFAEYVQKPDEVRSGY